MTPERDKGTAKPPSWCFQNPSGWLGHPVLSHPVVSESEAVIWATWTDFFCDFPGVILH